MKCQFCSNPATVHLTDIIDQQKKELHLCEACARQQQLLPEPKQELNLPALLNLLIGQHVSPVTEKLARSACPDCGTSYMEFRHAGRLGCPADYEVFREGLLPILERLHRSTRHTGKVPRHRAQNAARQAELLDLRHRLRSAVDAERYEEAAGLRDLLRQKEATDEP